MPSDPDWELLAARDASGRTGVKQSAGILLFRRGPTGLEVLLVHPGGPFWARKDAGAWTIPKGEYDPGEDPEAAARREFLEETGRSVEGPLIPLGEVVQGGRKRILAYAAEGSFDCAALESNSFEMEWPPRSGILRSFPEVDRAAWFDRDEARAKLVKAQAVFLDRLTGLASQAR